MDRNMRANALCDYIGVSQSTYTTWKRRDTIPEGNYIAMLGRLFGVSTDYILTGSDFGLDSDESSLIALYESLNDDGKMMLMEYARFLNTRYIKSNNAEAI